VLGAAAVWLLAPIFAAFASETPAADVRPAPPDARDASDEASPRPAPERPPRAAGARVAESAAPLGRARVSLVLALAGAVMAAEVAVAYDAVLGVICQGLVIVVVLNAAAIRRQPPVGRASRADAALLAIALVPLLRILSLTLPLDEVRRSLWPLVVGAPLLLAVVLAMRTLGWGPARIGLRRGRWPHEVGIALTGVPLSLIAFGLQPGADDVDTTSWLSAAIAVAGLLIGAAVIEELIFRGVLQQGLAELAGRVGVLAAVAMYVATYASSSFDAILVAALVALVLATHRSQGGALWGVMAARGLTLIGALLLWPHVFPGPPTGTAVDYTRGLVLFAIAMLAIAIAARPVRSGSGPSAAADGSSVAADPDQELGDARPPGPHPKRRRRRVNEPRR
jgi:membrane protease YdiL (CAAX protease family)